MTAQGAASNSLADPEESITRTYSRMCGPIIFIIPTGAAPSPADRKTSRKQRKQAKAETAKALNTEFQEMVEGGIDITKEVPHLFNLRELVMPNYIDKESEAVKALFDRGMKAMSEAIANRTIPQQPDDNDLIRVLPDEWRPYLPKGLTWEGSLMIMGGGFTHHPINRKTGLTVTMEDLGFNMTTRQRALLVELAGPRFNKKKQTLRLVTDNYPIRDQNRYHLLKQLCKLKETAIMLAQLEDQKTAELAAKERGEAEAQLGGELAAGQGGSSATDNNNASSSEGGEGEEGKQGGSTQVGQGS
eukprot:jgi/Mesvir1/15003/Mv14661-RA.1